MHPDSNTIFLPLQTVEVVRPVFRPCLYEALHQSPPLPDGDPTRVLPPKNKWKSHASQGKICHVRPFEYFS